MSDMRDYLKNKILSENLAGAYVALYSNGSEVSAPSYERKQAIFKQAEQGRTSTSEDILFPVARESWGDITDISIYDSKRNGNELFRSRPKHIQHISEVSQYKIPKDDLIIRLR